MDDYLVLLNHEKPPASSIVIVDRNAGLLLRQCIESVQRYSQDYEIVIVDNASTDNSTSLVKNVPDIRLLSRPTNLGHARASNIGIRESKGRYVVLLDPDTTVTPRWLDRLIDEAEKSRNVGIVAPKLLRPGNPPILDSTGHIYRFETGSAKDRGQGEQDTGRYNMQTELPSCCSAAVLIKREVFREIGLLDPHMFTISDDVDFGLRAKLAGWRIVFRPDSIVYHIRGGSTKEIVKDRVGALGVAYQLHTVLKIYQARNALLIGGRMFLMCLISVAAGIKNMDSAYARGYLKAIIWTVVHIPVKERIAFQRQRKISDKSLIPPGLSNVPR